MIAEVPVYDAERDAATDDPGPVVRVWRVRVESLRWDAESGSFEVEAIGYEEKKR